MVPLSTRRHHLNEQEIPEIIRGLMLRLLQLLDEREGLASAEIAYRALHRLTNKDRGRPKYPEFSWEYLDHYLDYHKDEY